MKDIVFVVFVGNSRCINITIIIISHVNAKVKPTYYMNNVFGEQNVFAHSKLPTHIKKIVFSFKSSNLKGKVMTV
jgi:hypothetical protein